MAKKIWYIICFCVAIIITFTLWESKEQKAFKAFIAEDYPKKELYKTYGCSCDKTKQETLLKNFSEPRCGCQMEEFQELIKQKFSNGTDMKHASLALFDMGMQIKGVAPCEKVSTNCAFVVGFEKIKGWTEYRVIFEVNSNNKIVSNVTSVWYVGL